LSVCDAQELPGRLDPADWRLMLYVMGAVKSALPDARFYGTPRTTFTAS